MPVTQTAHFERDLQLIELHVFDVNKLFQQLLVIGPKFPHRRFDIDVKLLKFVLSAYNRLDLAEIFDLIDHNQPVGVDLLC